MGSPGDDLEAQWQLRKGAVLWPEPFAPGYSRQPVSDYVDLLAVRKSPTAWNLVSEGKIQRAVSFHLAVDAC